MALRCGNLQENLPYCEEQQKQSRYNTRSSLKITLSAVSEKYSSVDSDTVVDEHGLLAEQETHSGVITRSQKRKPHAENLASLPSGGFSCKRKKSNLGIKGNAFGHPLVSTSRSVITFEQESNTPATTASENHISSSSASGAFPSYGIPSRQSSALSLSLREELCPSSVSCGSGLSKVFNNWRQDSLSEAAVSCEEELDEEDEPATDSVANYASQEEIDCGKRVLPEARVKQKLETCNSGCPALLLDQEVECMSPMKSSASYDDEIFLNLMGKERSRREVWGYMGVKQKELEVEHRRTMVNWLVEFSDEFALRSETLFLAVAIMDQFLMDGPQVKRNMLQLLGIASMLVAFKFEETQPKGYHMKVAKASPEMERMGEFLACLALMDYEFLKLSPSLISAAAVFLAAHILGREPWNIIMQERTGYSVHDLRDCVEKLHQWHHKVCIPYEQAGGLGNLMGIKDKYGRVENLQVSFAEAKDQLPDCLFKL
eukprot:jgi/Mesen1/7024/ME000365S06154